MELTLEQQRALALARARKRQAEEGSKPWELAKKQQEEANMTPEQEKEKLMLLAKARKRQAESQKPTAPERVAIGGLPSWLRKPSANAPTVPGQSEINQGMSNLVRLGANAATLGQADKFAAWMGGHPVDEERARTDQARKDAGIAGTATEILGSAALPGAAMRHGLTAARLIPQATARQRMLAAALDSGALGALSAARHADDGLTART